MAKLYLDSYGDELRHFGILGMKWGRRRYQNEDGSLTDAGRRRYGRQQAFESAFDRSINQGKGKDKISPAEQISKEVSKVPRSAVDAARGISRLQKQRARAKQDATSNRQLSKMSDDELRRRINRLDMERRYRDLNSATIRTGADKAADILDVAGDVSQIALSAVVTTAGILAIKKKLTGHY